VAVVVPSPATSFVWEATSWTRLFHIKCLSQERLEAWDKNSPSTQVLELIFERNSLGDGYTIYEFSQLAVRYESMKVAPLVIFGPP
jgi:hypothetical protein